MKKISRKMLSSQRGFALVGLLAAFAAVPPAILASIEINRMAKRAAVYMKQSESKRQMGLLRDYLLVNGSNPDADSFYELLKEGPGNTIPVAIPLTGTDSYGTAYRYCTWDLGVANVDPTYSQNAVAPPAAGMIGRLVSAGKDQTFQTNCGDAASAGDDVLLDIYDANARSTNGGIGGWVDTASAVHLLDPADNVGLGVTNPTHKLELAAGTTASAGIALGEVEVYRSAVNTLTVGAGNSLNLASGNISIAGTTVVDSSRNLTAVNGTFSGGTVSLSNATANSIVWGAAGSAAPNTTARSAGTKMVLWPSVGGGNADYAFGVEANALWSSVAGVGQSFKWYGGSTLAMQLTGGGNLTAYGSTTLGDAAADSTTVRGSLLLSDSAVGTPLTFGGDVGLYRGAANVLALASGDSLNLVSGDLQVGGTTVVNSSRQLANVAGVGTDLIPTATDTYNLGSALAQYNNVYTKNLYVNGGSVLGGSGNLGYIPKFTAANTLGNSLITDTGTGIQVAGTMKGYSLQLSDLNAIISTDTVDGSDTKRLQLAGGGTVNQIRGGYINLHGNEHASYPGWISMLAGGPSGIVNIFTNWGELARFNEAGRILFGGTTDDATNRLQVYGTVMSKSVNNASTGRFTAHNEDATSSVIATSYGSAYVGNVLGVPAANWGMLVANGANSNGLVVGTYTAKPLVFGTNNAEVGRFTSDGKLLLGTTTNDGTSVLQANGNLALIGTGRRILADFSNGAALNNRAAFQSSVTNGATIVNAIPNGTGGSSIWRAFNTTDMDNSSYVQMMVNATTAQILSGNVGTGTALPLSFVVGGAERFRLNTNGTIYTPGLTASRVVFTDASQNLTSTGTVGVGQGGTGLTGTPTNGQLPIGNGTGFTLGTLAGSNGVTVTNSAGGIGLSLGLGAAGTAGTLDWNDVSNTTPGSTATLLLGTATNGMGGGGNYFHPLNFEYASKNGTGNVTQLGIPYGNSSIDSGIWVRGRYSGAWTGWKNILYSDFSNASGTLGVNKGGTGLTSYTVGDLLYASGATTLSKLADVATGNALISGGVGVAPAWGKIGLTTHVSGTLPIGNGGTGVTGTPTNGQLLIGNGTGYTIAGLTGTANQVIVTNGAGSITLSLPQSIATTSTPTFAGLTLNGTAAQLSLTNATSNMILFGAGSAAPAYTTRSAGTKIILSSALTGTTADYALGIEANALWSSVPSSSQAFKWYAGTSQIASLTGDGRLGLGTQAATDAILQVLGHGGIPYYSPASWYAGQKMGQGTALYWAKGAGSYTYSMGQSGDTFYFGKSTTEASGAGGSTDYMMRLDGDGRTFINSLHGGGTAGAVRISTLTGYVDIGSMNASFAHIQTDRPTFYMNAPLRVDGAIYGHSNSTFVYGGLTIGGDKNGYAGLAFSTAAGAYVGNLMVSTDRRHWGLYDQNVGWKMLIDATAKTVEFRGDGNAPAVLTTPATYAP